MIDPDRVVCRSDFSITVAIGLQVVARVQARAGEGEALAVQTVFVTLDEHARHIRKTYDVVADILHRIKAAIDVVLRACGCCVVIAAGVQVVRDLREGVDVVSGGEVVPDVLAGDLIAAVARLDLAGPDVVAVDRIGQALSIVTRIDNQSPVRIVLMRRHDTADLDLFTRRCRRIPVRIFNLDLTVIRIVSQTLVAVEGQVAQGARSSLAAKVVSLLFKEMNG